jgi:hypothetical protein
MTENNEISQNISPCALCGLDVLVSSFKVETLQGQKAFCCEGCKAIFKMLNDDIVLPSQEKSANA